MKSNLRNLYARRGGGVVLALVACLLQTGCKPGGTGEAAGRDSTSDRKVIIQVKGSDTMVNLAQVWAEEYLKMNSDVSIEVSGGGTGVGFAALTSGTVDMANASRNMRPEEVEQAKKNTGKEPMEFVMGYDALAIYVHKDNPLNEITEDQLADIYAESGKLTKWGQLGVKVPAHLGDEIIRVSRQSSSGTYELFRERVLKNQDFKLGSRDLNGSKEVVELVASTPGAIGYSGMGYATPGVKMLKVGVAAGQRAYAPTVENTLNKTYPIARSLLTYTLGAPQGAVKEYLDWQRSEAGQEMVKKTGFVPLTEAAPAP